MCLIDGKQAGRRRDADRFNGFMQRAVAMVERVMPMRRA